MKNNNKNALIIGASSSIGATVTAKFAAEGFRVLATFSKQPFDNNIHESIESASIDLLSEDSLDYFVDNTIKSFGKIDVVIFLVGILPGLSIDDYDDSLMKEVMGINFIGQAALLRRLRPSLTHGASVLFVSSISGSRGSFDPIYAASKAAQNAFVKSLSSWLSPQIRVNALAPGLIQDSTMFNDMSVERREHHKSLTPTNRLTNKQEIADILYNLSDPLWSNLSGQVIHIDGGSYV